MAAIEQTGETVMVTDPDCIIQYVNPAFEQVTGYGRQEAIGQHVRMLESGEHDQGFFQGLSQTISSGRTWRGTMVNKRKDGTLCTQEGTASPVYDAGGEIVSCVVVLRDVTGQRQMEEQLRQAQKMETVGQLAGGVAHDFNNMLQVIISYVEMALEKVEVGQPLHKYLLEVRKAAQRSAELTGQLLAFARKQAVSPKVVNLNEAVASTRKMIQRLIGEEIDLAWMPGHDVWKVKIDPAQLDQVLANLAVNARDAIRGVGRLTVETKNVTLDEGYCAAHLGSVPGEYVLLAVSDNGCGMDRETLSHLFEPFFTTKVQGKGTGLGLATIYGIVKQNDGFIEVSSEPGQGSTFRVYLPRVEGTEAAGPQQVEAEAAAPRGGTETVLVAEDEAAILELARESLEQLGYTVLTAKLPEEAMRKAGEHARAIELLITDVVMPQMNGRQLCDRLRAVRPGLKCLYMSGYTADVIAHRGLLEEGVSFIAKPFSLATLAVKVREVLDG
jgi:two-component system cell cycle sensor histidine kinase/response regulator CckA